MRDPPSSQTTTPSSTTPTVSFSNSQSPSTPTTDQQTTAPQTTTHKLSSIRGGSYIAARASTISPILPVLDVWGDDADGRDIVDEIMKKLNLWDEEDDDDEPEEESKPRSSTASTPRKEDPPSSDSKNNITLSLDSGIRTRANTSPGLPASKSSPPQVPNKIAPISPTTAKTPQQQGLPASKSSPPQVPIKRLPLKDADKVVKPTATRGVK